MSNITERALMQALAEILTEHPLDRIKVKDITDRCGLTRNTFYYHFHDVYEALEYYFETEIQKLVDKYGQNADWLGLFREGLDFIYEHKLMIENIYNFIDWKTLRDYLDSTIFKYVLAAIEGKFSKNNYSEGVIVITAEFYSSALLGATVKWIKNGMNEKPENLAKIYSNIYDGTIEQLLSSINESIN